MKRMVLLLLLIILTAASSGHSVCSYQDVLDYLNLTTDNSVFRLTRPVLDHTQPTIINLDVYLYAILSVAEKTQTFIPFLWTLLEWSHERIKWDPAQFCGITQVSVPKELVWVPDLFIYEMIEKDDSPKSPYAYLLHNGTVYTEAGLRIVSTCKMDVHKFPFDTQSCSISIGSNLHSMDEVLLVPFSNSSRATQFSRELMKTYGEWEFLEMSVSKSNITYHEKLWDQLVYTIIMRRRPLLYVINLLLPIIFFLILDMASYFISDHRGEKLGFKVTVLLAISVLLLILNDILPCMSSRTPLIGTYCIVIFALMLLSLLVTILVTHLIEKDCENGHRTGETSEDGEVTVKADNSSGDNQQHTLCSCVCSTYTAEKQHELLPVNEEVCSSSSVQTTEAHLLVSVVDELKELQKTLRLQLNNRKGRGKSTLWAARINRAFFIFYIVTVSLFLPLIYIEWTS